MRPKKKLTWPGSRIKALREKMGISQAILAVQVDAEGGKRTVCRWEQNEDGQPGLGFRKQLDNLAKCVEWS